MTKTKTSKWIEKNPLFLGTLTVVPAFFIQMIFFTEIKIIFGVISIIALIALLIYCEKIPKKYSLLYVICLNCFFYTFILFGIVNSQRPFIQNSTIYNPGNNKQLLRINKTLKVDVRYPKKVLKIEKIFPLQSAYLESIKFTLKINYDFTQEKTPLISLEKLEKEALALLGSKEVQKEKQMINQLIHRFDRKKQFKKLKARKDIETYIFKELSNRTKEYGIEIKEINIKLKVKY
jgi:hypothetical protein